VGQKVAEFAIECDRDVSLSAGRARLVGLLAGLASKRSAKFAKAVGEVARNALMHAGGGRIEFRVSEEDGRHFVEAAVCDAGPGIAFQEHFAPETTATTGSADSGLIRARQAVDRFLVTSSPESGTVVRLGQSLPAAVPLDGNVLADWATVLSTKSSQQALVASFQRLLEVNRELSSAQRHGMRLEEELISLKSADQQQSLLSLVASKTDSAVVILDQEGVIEWVNDGFVRMTGYELAEVAGRRPGDVLHGPATDPGTVEEIDEAVRNRHGLTWEILHYRKDGRRYWASGSLTPVFDEQGTQARSIAVYTDMTKRRQAQEALEQAKEAAETASRAKSEFLANMSHEIRTPMNAIIGMTELALCTDLTPEQHEYLTMARESAESLLRLLNDILDLSKIEAGKMEIDAVDFNLSDLVAETMKALAVRASQKGIELACHIPSAVPSHLVGDPARLRQVLINLVGNAIKFTGQGEVVARVEPEWQTEDEVALHFSVQDTGIGISADRLQQIFEPFRQGDSSTTRRFGGTGLGLTISAQLIDLMHGKIWVQSKLGKGSTFHFSLRLKLQAQPPASPAPVDAGKLAGTKVLVVDDNATNRLILKEYLLSWGMQPTLAENAERAMTELRNAAAKGRPFRLVLSDAVMPGTDGFGLARKIRQDPALAVATIMMLSSADRPGALARCRQLGVAAYLTKPVSPCELQNAILDARGTKPGKRPCPIPPEEVAASPRVLRVLVADDNEANRFLATTILEKRGHHVLAVGSGQEALLAIETDRFDVAVMDIQMPEMDGFAATAAVRESERRTGHHLPIVAMTAYAMKGDRERCLAAGMDAYLAKPIRARELQAIVASLGSASLGDRAAATLPAASGASSGFARALARLEGDVGLLKAQMGFLLQDVPALLDRLRSAIAEREGRALELAAHRLAGLVGNFDAEEAVQCARSLESMGGEQDFAEAETACRELDLHLAGLREAVEEFLARH
jgi:two-component system sensor histidine kinase/response regulator